MGDFMSWETVRRTRKLNTDTQPRGGPRQFRHDHQHLFEAHQVRAPGERGDRYFHHQRAGGTNQGLIARRQSMVLCQLRAVAPAGIG